MAGSVDWVRLGARPEEPGQLLGLSRPPHPTAAPAPPRPPAAQRDLLPAGLAAGWRGGRAARHGGRALRHGGGGVHGCGLRAHRARLGCGRTATRGGSPRAQPCVACRLRPRCTALSCCPPRPPSLLPPCVPGRQRAPRWTSCARCRRTRRAPRGWRRGTPRVVRARAAAGPVCGAAVRASVRRAAEHLPLRRASQATPQPSSARARATAPAARALWTYTPSAAATGRRRAQRRWAASQVRGRRG